MKTYRTLIGAWLIAIAWLASPPVHSQETAPAVSESAPSLPSVLPFSALTRSGHWELRIYTINRGQLDAFVDAWLQGVYPVRIEQGFQIPAAWVSRANNQFIWVLGYDGPDTWEDKQRAYYASSARQALDVDPLDMIAHGETWPLAAVTPER